jgi:hypothetical protein
VDVHHHPFDREPLEAAKQLTAPWLDRMDRHFDDQGLNSSGLKTRPPPPGAEARPAWAGRRN